MATTLRNCSYEYDTSDGSFGQTIINVDFSAHLYSTYACTPFKWEYALNLLCVVLWLVGYRWLYDLFMRVQRRGVADTFRLADQLTARDNPALAIDFASFLFSMCLITRGSLSGDVRVIQPARYFGSFFAYQAVGAVVILIARVLNDKLMLRAVDNIKAMVEERSVAVALVQAGTTIATALIFAASCSGSDSSFGEGLGLTIVYWAIGQPCRAGAPDQLRQRRQLRHVACTRALAPSPSPARPGDGSRDARGSGARAGRRGPAAGRAGSRRRSSRVHGRRVALRSDRRRQRRCRPLCRTRSGPRGNPHLRSRLRGLRGASMAPLRRCRPPRRLAAHARAHGRSSGVPPAPLARPIANSHREEADAARARLLCTQTTL